MNRVEFLRRLPLFEDLPDETIERLCGSAPDVEVPAGERLLVEGILVDAMYVVVEGEFAVLRRAGEREVEVGRAGEGEVLGEFGLVLDVPATATARALVDSSVIAIDRDAFGELIDNPVSVLAMLRTIVRRLETSEAALRENEKMAALGRTTAGLLHELNNPAAAIQRGSERLATQLDETRALAVRLQRAGVELDPDLVLGADDPPTDLLSRGDREDEIATWLEERGVDEGWHLAPELVAGGWDVDRLERLTDGLAGEVLGDVARWIALGVGNSQLTSELRVASRRISDLVGAAKRFAHVDEAPVQDVDVNQALADTLTIYNQRIGGDVKVRTEYAPDLPRVEGYASDLTTVWSNLVDNALDAMPDGGELVVRSAPGPDGGVRVEVVDTGSGIPDEVRDRIFEPFVTSKPLGQGTGIGLHTVYQVVARHGGAVTVATGADGTTFRVTLPARLPHRPG